MKGVAHLMLSFEFNDGRCFSFSFEARRTIDDSYHPWHGMWRAYEMYLVMGTEKDLVGIRAFKRGNQVHRYRTVTSKRRRNHSFSHLLVKCRVCMKNQSFITL